MFGVPYHGGQREALLGAERRSLRDAEPSSALTKLFAWANALREEELAGAMRRLGPGPARDRRVIEAMGRRIVSKLIARPMGFARRKYRTLQEEEKLELLRAVFSVENAIDENPPGN